MLIPNFTYVLITYLPEIRKEDFFIIHTKYTKIQKKTFPNLIFAKYVASIGFTTIVFQVKGKGKAIPLQAWTGPEGSRRLRLPDFKTIGT